MNDSKDDVPLRIKQWAARQLADYDANNPGSVFAEGVVLNVAERYELQAAVAELRRRRGEQVVAPEDARGDPSLAIFADGQLLDECTGPSLVQTISFSLQWLIEFVRNRGDRLSAGQIILTGSIPSLVPIGKDCRITVHAPPFGTVEVNITA